MTWALAHPYLTTILGLSAMLLTLIVVDYAFTAFSNCQRVRLVEKGHKP